MALRRSTRLLGPRLVRSPSFMVCTLLLAPMGVGIRIPDDSAAPVPVEESDPDAGLRSTTLRFGAGGGRYGRTVHAERVISLGYDSCTGYPANETIDAEFRFKDEFRDYGGELDVQVRDNMHFGMRGGWIDETTSFVSTNLDQAVIDTLFTTQRFDSSATQFYLNPCFAFEYPTWGVGFGVVFSNNRLWTDDRQEYGDHDDETVYPTGHVRLGRPEKVYFTASLWEGVPIYSGGGMLTFGIGLRPVRPLDLWVGFSDGGPWTNRNFLLRANADIGRHLTLGAAVRLKSDADGTYLPSFSEYGTSFTLGYRFLRE